MAPGGRLVVAGSLVEVGMPADGTPVVGRLVVGRLVADRLVADRLVVERGGSQVGIPVGTDIVLEPVK